MEYFVRLLGLGGRKSSMVEVEQEYSMSIQSFVGYLTENSSSFMFSPHSSHSSLNTQQCLVDYKGDIFRLLLESLIGFMTTYAEELAEKSDVKCNELHDLINMNVHNVVNFAELYSILAVHGWIESGSNFFPSDVYSSYSLQRGLRMMLLSDREVLAKEDTLSFSPNILSSIHSTQNAFGSLFEGGDVSTPVVPLSASRIHFDATVLLADISGFTKLSCSYCKQGREGLDKLHATVDGFLDSFVQIVYAHRGDVIAFAGDALLCVFRSDNRDSVGSPKQHCLQAMQCAMKLREKCTRELTAHIAVSCGSVGFATLGGFNGEWTSLMNGACIASLSSCIDEAKAKQVVVTDMVYQELLRIIPHEDFMSRVTDSGNRLIISFEEMETKPVCSRFSKNIDEELLQRIRCFIPRPALLAIQSNCLSSISELRRVTTLFLKIDSYCPIANRDPLTLQPFFLMAQKVLVSSGGYLRQFLIDDKGCVLIAMWGVPTASYSHNCHRAVQTAVNIRNGAHELDMEVSVGVTTGDIFCGSIGSSIRRDYVGIGDKVNLSARLMGKAKGKIYIDEETYQMLPMTFHRCLNKTEALLLKGIRKPMHVYCYDLDATASVDYMEMLDESKHAGDNLLFLQPNVKEVLLRQLEFAVEATAETGQRTVFNILVEGAAGSGKPMAAQYFRYNAAKMHYSVFEIHCNDTDRTKLYGVAKKLLFNLCFKDKKLDAHSMIKYVENLYKQLPWTDFSSYDTVTPDSINTTLFSIFEVEYSCSISRRYRRKERVNSFMNEVELHSHSHRHGEAELEQDCYEHVLRFVIYQLLLKCDKTAISIENVHYIDECSWTMLNAILEMPVFCILLITKLSDGDSNSGGVDNSYTNSDESNTHYSPVTRSNSIVSASSVGLTPKQLGGERHGSFSRSPSISRIISRQSSFASMANSFISLFASHGSSHIADLSQACLNVLHHPNTLVLKMSPLDFVGVKYILTELLDTKDVLTDEVVQNILDVSSGNPYWCEEISHFILEKGVSQFLKTMDRNNRSLSKSEKKSSLRTVVVTRLEQLSSIQKVILKYASVMAEQFSLSFLLLMLPSEMDEEEKVQELDSLIALRFLSAQGGADEQGELLYGFENKLIHELISELTPASDVFSIHHQIGEHLETIHAEDLEPYYAILGHHYSMAGEGDRVKAIHLFLKAAYTNIFNTAFIDAASNCQHALRLTRNVSEVKFVNKTIDYGSSELQKKKIKQEKARFRLRKHLGGVYSQESKAFSTLQTWAKKKYDDLKPNVEMEGIFAVQEEEDSSRSKSSHKVLSRRSNLRSHNNFSTDSYIDHDPESRPGSQPRSGQSASPDRGVNRNDSGLLERSSSGMRASTKVDITIRRKARANKIALANETIDADLRELIQVPDSVQGSNYNCTIS